MRFKVTQHASLSLDVFANVSCGAIFSEHLVPIS